MAQPAVLKNTLENTPLRQKASVETLTVGDICNQLLFLVIIAKDGSNLQKFHGPATPTQKSQQPGNKLPFNGEPKHKLEVETWEIRKKEYKGRINVNFWTI